MTDKLSIRPILHSSLLSGELTEIERFQNATLRPILKLQHHLILAITSHYIAKKKNVFFDLEFVQQEKYIADQIIGDKHIRTELNGIILGLMNVEEYGLYSKHVTEIKKRIKAMLLQRILSDISELTP